MSHKNKKSLTKQVQDVYESKLRIGQSKHKDKHDGVSDGYIYSYGTLKSYLKEANYFVKFCKQNYGCKTLEQCKPHVAEWIDSRRHLSAYTLKLDLSALAKLYGVKSNDFGIDTPARVMSKITRSRGVKKRDKHFSEKRNADFVEFCKSTGKRYQSEVYVCRSENKGKRLDKRAMYEVSHALGHNRLCVVGEHYIR